MLFNKYQSFWSFNHHEWTNIPNSHYKRHCIKNYTCWNVTTIRQLNRPPEVNITLIIQNLVLFFHWMQPNTLNLMQYFSAKTKIISLSLTLCLTHVCNFVENVFWRANKTSNLPIFRNIQSSYWNTQTAPTAGPNDSIQGKNSPHSARFLWKITYRNRLYIVWQKFGWACQGTVNDI